MALKGIVALELAGLAPGPMCGMLLRDFGANVLRIDRPNSPLDYDCLAEGKQSISLDITSDRGKDIFQQLCRKSDVLIEPFRPGVMEKLGLGPDVLLKTNSKLIFARLSGYGQTGSLAKTAGHDINYIAMSGVLSMLGKHSVPPSPPVNLLADFAGGGLLCAYAILAALIERQRTGAGKVLDMSLSEGSSYVASWLFRSKGHPEVSSVVWRGKYRGSNLLDGGYPLYRTYETADGGYMAVGAIEPKFAETFLQNFDCPDLSINDILSGAPSVFSDIATHFRTKTRDEWTTIFEGTDACCTPVLSPDDAASHAHNRARAAFKLQNGVNAPNAHPASLVDNPAPAPEIGQDSRAVLRDLGFSDADVDLLVHDDIVQEPGAKSKL